MVHVSTKSLHVYARTTPMQYIPPCFSLPGLTTNTTTQPPAYTLEKTTRWQLQAAVTVGFCLGDLKATVTQEALLLETENFLTFSSNFSSFIILCFCLTKTIRFPLKIYIKKLLFIVLSVVAGHMKNFTFAFLLSEAKSRTSVATLILTASLIFCLYFVGTAFYANDLKVLQMDLKDAEKCKNRCRPPGSQALPEGILAKTSDLKMRPLWGSFDNSSHSSRSVSLLAISAGIKQKYLVNDIITKFLENDFVIMVFHYDGIVDQWNDLQWASQVLHVSAMNQTKWWFAKRFLHPDIVAEYDYIFLWDEDLDIKQFNPDRYISIVKEEELDISQPALDPRKSEIHHQITVRQMNSKVHRRYFKLRGGGRCYDNSTGPPCFGWVEMMAPVFSKAAWRCAWYLIQNDLIHGWGIDFQLGYCAQGDRKQKVGVVDAEYIVHLGVPSLGGSNHASNVSLTNHVNTKNLTYTGDLEKPSNNSGIQAGDDRGEVRKQSYTEMRIFWRRWNKAVENDKCWVDRYAYENRNMSNAP